MVCIGMVRCEPCAVDGLDSINGIGLESRLFLDRVTKIFVHNHRLQIRRRLIESLKLVRAHYNIGERSCFSGRLPGLEIQSVHNVVDSVNVVSIDGQSEDFVSIIRDPMGLKDGG